MGIEVAKVQVPFFTGGLKRGVAKHVFWMDPFENKVVSLAVSLGGVCCSRIRKRSGSSAPGSHVSTGSILLSDLLIDAHKRPFLSFSLWVVRDSRFGLSWMP